jgi:hypothetical protein
MLIIEELIGEVWVGEKYTGIIYFLCIFWKPKVALKTEIIEGKGITTG